MLSRAKRTSRVLSQSGVPQRTDKQPNMSLKWQEIALLKIYSFIIQPYTTLNTLQLFLFVCLNSYWAKFQSFDTNITQTKGHSMGGGRRLLKPMLIDTPDKPHFLTFLQPHVLPNTWHVVSSRRLPFPHARSYSTLIHTEILMHR